MNKVCQIDTRDLMNILNKLDEERRRDVMYKSLTKGGQRLVKETKDKLRKELPSGAASGKRYGTPMESGIKLAKNKDYDEVKVHIMGDYRLRFFEMGTEDRYIRKTKGSKTTESNYKFRKNEGSQGKTGYRGSIRAKHFFKQARDNAQVILDEIIQNLQRGIDKLIKQ